MKKILLIDDLRVFRVTPEDAEVTTARTSADAMQVLLEAPDAIWDEVWFDHDLGSRTIDNDTTRKIADYFCERAFNDNPVNVKHVYVHSSNSAGVKYIYDGLKTYGYSVSVERPDEIFRIDVNLHNMIVDN